MAKSAFDHCADAYSRYRPDYPPAVFEGLEGLTGPPARRLIADVGAGTGKFTHALAARGWRVLAIDPSVNMLKEGRQSQSPRPDISHVVAVAESLPLADAAIPAITCAQAFHWFNPPVALAEFARVLHPHGTLLLTWNNRDTDDPFVADYERLIAEWNPAYRCEYRRQDWAGKVAATGLFAPMTCSSFQWDWHMPAEAFVGFARSASYLRNVIPAARWQAFEQSVRDMLTRHFAAGECRVPMLTEAWTTSRLP
jgi:SAM-dependent methyltransferase